MSNSIIELNQYVANHTEIFRKGEEVTTKQVGPVKVITIDAMPPAEQAPPDTVDVHFFVVSFSEDTDRGEFSKLLCDACDSPGEFANISRERLLQGPSYIELGGWLGSQGIALRFLALGLHVGLFGVITPERLGFTGEQADGMAGGGFVMLGPTQELKEVLSIKAEDDA